MLPRDLPAAPGTHLAVRASRARHAPRGAVRIIGAAPRFQPAGGVLCALLTSVVATVAAAGGVGAFAGPSRTGVMAKLGPPRTP
ncbi:hypothetical protein ACWC2M_23820 [Streptomyces sp. NPDC001761]